jgi:hypothetical protein
MHTVSSLIGRTLARCEILDQIRGGGTGVVYRRATPA